MMWSINEIIHTLTAVVDESEEWSLQLISSLGNWKEEAWKHQDFNGIRTRDLCDAGVMLYQLSYEATHWERGQFIEFISPLRSENNVKYIWNNSYFNCGCRWTQQSLYELNKLNSLQMCGFAEVTGSNPAVEALIFPGFFPIA